MDITMCKGQECQNKTSCWRFRANPTPFMQSFFVHPPYILDYEDDGVTPRWECEYYWEFKEKDNE